MILNIAKKHKINLNQSYMVGDRAIDVEAGQRANCRTIFINRNYREKAPNKQEATFVNLPQAVKYILNQEKINNA